MWENKKKAVTFSFDDGVDEDIRFIELLDKYNMKGTFNLNSGKLGLSQTRPIWKLGELEGADTMMIEGKLYHKEFTTNHYISYDKIKEVYKNHEVACHTLTHPNLLELDDETILYQVEQDRKLLCELTGQEVCGLAYPCGGANSDERIQRILKTKTGIKYARTNKMTFDFEMPTDLYNTNMTISFAKTKELFELAEKFVKTEFDHPVCFAFFGHTYELQDDYASWETIEDFCKIISNKNDIFYGTCKQVYLGK